MEEKRIKVEDCIIGKWYKMGIYINKFAGKHYTDNFGVIETTKDNGIYEMYNRKFTNDSVIEREVSLSEIQEYLPDDHPDKFPKEALLTNIL